MGFGVSGATAIVFLSLFVCTGMLYTSTSNAAERMEEAKAADHDRLLEQRNTAIAVRKNHYNSTNDTLILEVENTGSETLSVEGTTLLVDNDYVESLSTKATVDGVSGTDFWEPGDVLRIEVTAPNAGRAKVVTENGISKAVPAGG